MGASVIRVAATISNPFFIRRPPLVWMQSTCQREALFRQLVEVTLLAAANQLGRNRPLLTGSSALPGQQRLHVAGSSHLNFIPGFLAERIECPPSRLVAGIVINPNLPGSRVLQDRLPRPAHVPFLPQH